MANKNALLSKSLIPRGADFIATLTQNAQQKHPAPESNNAAANASFVLDKERVYAKTADGAQPLVVQSTPLMWRGFFNVKPGDEGRPARLLLHLMITFPRSDSDDKEVRDAFMGQQDSFFQALYNLYGAGNLMARAVKENFNRLTGKQKPPGVTPKNLMDKIVEDQQSVKGVRARFMFVPLKERTVSEEDLTPTYEFGFDLPLSISTTVPREMGKLPAALQSAYKAVHGEEVPTNDPVIEFFANNPDTDLAPVQITTADKNPHPFSTIAAATVMGKKGPYVRFLASATIGGASFSYYPVRRIFTSNIWPRNLNGKPGGVRVYGICGSTGTEVDGSDNEEDDLYETQSTSGGSKRRASSGDDELYSEDLKRAREEEP